MFTNNFIDLDILSVSATSCYWLLVGRGRGAAKHLPVHKTAPQQRIIWPNVNSTKKLHKPLLTCSISHSAFSIHCTNLFLYFRCVFTFLEIIKHNTPKCCIFFSIFSIKIAAQKFTDFDKFYFKCTLA